MLKSKWLRLLIFLPLLVLLVGVNVFGDAGNRLHSSSDVMAEALVAGYPAYVVSGNMNEIELRYRYICRMPDDIECVVMGASTVMCITSNDAGQEKFVNLGNSGGQIEEILAYLGTMRLLSKDVHLQRVILVPCEYWFNRKRIDLDIDSAARNALTQYTNYMFDTINGIDTTGRQVPPADFSSGFNLFFSLSYFQANVKYITGSDMINQKRIGIMGEEDDEYDGYCYMPDGSFVYWKKKILNDENDVIIDAEKSLLEESELNRYTEHLEAEKCRIFEKLVEYLTAKGITVDIFLIPIAPALWDGLDQQKHPFFFELEDYLTKIAAKYHLRIIGSYNPYNVGITNADFYDARHIRRGHFSKYFDLKPDKF